MPDDSPRRHGFTLIELLVVISIIALLVGILLPSLTAARESARSIACASNQRNVMIGLTVAADENKGYLPDLWLTDPGPDEGFGDWSGRLADDQLAGPDVFLCPSDDLERSNNGSVLDPDDNPYRSYVGNDGRFVPWHDPFNYRTPWGEYAPASQPRAGAVVAGTQTARLGEVPGHVMVISEAHHGWFNRSPDGEFLMVVGKRERTANQAIVAAAHQRGLGGNYGFSDGRVEFRRFDEVSVYRKDTPYDSSTNDPWKWKD